MIEGLSSRRSVAQVRASGVSVRRGSLRVVYRPVSGSGSRFAFGVPRSVGSAVVRNRARRRVQAILRDLDREFDDLPRPGEYFIGIAAPLERLSYLELRAMIIDLLRRSGKSQ